MVFHIGIIGSGPAGLTAALALEHATSPDTVAITLIDRNHDAVDYPGVEYGIQARACRALERLGLKEAALATGHPTDSVVLYRPRTDRVQAKVPVDPAYTFDVRRTEFLENLGKLLRRTTNLRRHDVAAITPLAGRRVRLAFAPVNGAEPEPLEFDLVIAADGAHSQARRQYFPEAGTFDRGFSLIYLGVEGAPDDPRTPAAFPRVANDGSSIIAMGSFVTAALFAQGYNRMTIAMGFDHATAARVWRAHGLAPETAWHDIPAETKAALAAHFARDTPIEDGLIAASLALVEDWNSPRVYRWMMSDSDPLPNPYAPDCDLVLVGDSCHAFLPTIGMGASLAIEDAEMLGTRLGERLNAQAGVGSAAFDLRRDIFAPFARDRYPVWTDLMQRARAAARNWMDQAKHDRFETAPYIPNKMVHAVVETVEGVERRLRRAG